MKNLVATLILIISLNCFSQNKQLLYNFTSIPQSLMTNPGSDIQYKWYMGVPLLSGISANVSSSGFTAYDLFSKNGIDFNTKLRNVISAVSRNDKIAINQQLEIFNVGFRIKNEFNTAFVSFGMYQELDMFAYMPKDYALLALNGNQDYIGKIFDLSDMNLRGELLSVFHFGLNKRINKKLIVGARAKIYSSIFNVSSTKNYGYLYTIPAENQFYKQVISSNLNLNTSGFTNYTKNYSGNAQSDIVNKTFLAGNTGLGFDAGLTYYPKDNIQYTASISDVGFIRHTKQIENYGLNGNFVQDGLSPDFLNPSTSTTSFIEKFKEDIPYVNDSKKYTSFRLAKLNASFQYSFGKKNISECNCSENEQLYTNSFGAHFFAMFTPRIPMMALTTFYRKKIKESLELKASYTLDSFSNNNIGLGVSTQLKKINFYFLADNLLEYKDLSRANSLSFQLGFNIIFADKQEKN